MGFGIGFFLNHLGTIFSSVLLVLRKQKSVEATELKGNPSNTLKVYWAVYQEGKLIPMQVLISEQS